MVLGSGNPPDLSQPYEPVDTISFSSQPVNLFSIPGASGDNYTGVSVGGFEASDTSYIAAFTTVDQSKISQYTPEQKMYGRVGNEQSDVMLCVLPKNSASASDVKQITLGKYIGTDKTATAPYLVKLGGDKFAVLWQEYAADDSSIGDMVCELVNGEGEPIGAARHFQKVGLPSFQPALDPAGNITWLSDHGAFSDRATPLKFYRFNPLTGAIATFAPKALSASPTSSSVVLNGRNVSFDAYTIAGSNYFKLRDLAYALNGTEKQFSVGWDGAAGVITLKGGEPYAPVGGEMGKKGTSEVKPEFSTASLLIGGEKVSLTAYTIGGNNYFKLRDIAGALDFEVDWDGARNTVVIDTSKSYTPD